MIGIIDYGMGNLRSVQKAFEAVGHSAPVVTEPAQIARASKLVLPGVGAFGDAMRNLHDRGAIGPLLDAAQRGVLILGICLGLQLFFEESSESGVHEGLGLFKGRVRRFPESARVPHIGWNQIRIRRKSGILNGVPDGSFFYFVHSYYADPANEKDIVTTTDYGVDYASVVGNETIFGVQFHPEKSQELGLRILRNFGEL